MARNYEDLSRDELIRLLEARDRRVATRLGLVWESNETERDKTLNKDFVALDLDKSLCIGTGPWRNLLIEGDNFDALRFLRMTFAGRVKCILIDPPYNTGNKDFIYNDRFVEKEHLWRHSLWLDSMHQRLTIARDLLREDGVILVHIGEEEVHRLGCLLDQVFPGRKVGSFVWRTRSGANDSKEYFRSIDHEYVLCYANPQFEFGGHAKALKDYQNPDNDSRDSWVSSDLTAPKNFRERPGTFYAIRKPESDIWYPCNPDRVWAYASGVEHGDPSDEMMHYHFAEAMKTNDNSNRAESMFELIRANKVLWPDELEPASYNTMAELLSAIENGTAPRNLRQDTPDLGFWVGKRIGRTTPRRKKFRSEVKKLERPLSTWIVPAADKKEARAAKESLDSTHMVVGGTSEGTSLLRRMLGNVSFPYPKPLSLVQSLVEQCTESDDLVVDFFAGSCTTGHAVLSLNASDGGERRFILVSSTEATENEPDKNVCKETGRRRLKAAIEGYEYTTKSGKKRVEGLGGDVAYLRCRRLSPGRLTDIDHAEVWTALQLMHCEAIQEYQEGSILQAGNEDQLLIYLPRSPRANANVLRKAVKESREAIVYSWQPEVVRQLLHGEANVQVEAVPESMARRFGMKI